MFIMIQFGSGGIICTCPREKWSISSQGYVQTSTTTSLSGIYPSFESRNDLQHFRQIFLTYIVDYL